MNPRQMQRMLAQMGIKTEEIKANEVVIRKEDGEIIIREPQIVAMDVQGLRSFQITGRVEEKKSEFPEDDIRLVMEQAKATREKALEALRASKGDIAGAILKLQQ